MGLRSLVSGYTRAQSFNPGGAKLVSVIDVAWGLIPKKGQDAVFHLSGSLHAMVAESFLTGTTDFTGARSTNTLDVVQCNYSCCNGRDVSSRYSIGCDHYLPCRPEATVSHFRLFPGPSPATTTLSGIARFNRNPPAKGLGPHSPREPSNTTSTK